MKTVWAIVAAFVLVVLLAGTALAQAKPAEKAKAPVQKAAKTEPAVVRHQVSGEVVSTDIANKTLVVKGKDKQTSFIASDKAAHALATLKTGESVIVRYTEEAGKLVATSVVKAKAKAETAKPPKK